MLQSRFTNIAVANGEADDLSQMRKRARYRLLFILAARAAHYLWHGVFILPVTATSARTSISENHLYRRALKSRWYYFDDDIRVFSSRHCKPWSEICRCCSGSRQKARRESNVTKHSYIKRVGVSIVDAPRQSTSRHHTIIILYRRNRGTPVHRKSDGHTASLNLPWRKHVTSITVSDGEYVARCRQR